MINPPDALPVPENKSNESLSGSIDDPPDKDAPPPVSDPELPEWNQHKIRQTGNHTNNFKHTNITTTQEKNTTKTTHITTMTTTTTNTPITTTATYHNHRLLLHQVECMVVRRVHCGRHAYGNFRLSIAVVSRQLLFSIIKRQRANIWKGMSDYRSVQF